MPFRARIMLFLTLFLFGFGASSAMAIDPPADLPPMNLSADVASQLLPIKAKIATLVELENAGVIASGQKDAGVDLYLAQASKLAGQQVDLATLLSFNETVQATPTKMSIGQQILGFITFTNIILVLAGIAFVICFFVFFGEILLNIPKVVWEVMFYLLAFGVMIYGKGLGDMANYVGLLGGALFVGALAFSFGTRTSRRAAHVPETFFTILCTVLFPLAFIYNSALIAGLLAIPAFMGLLGFTVMMVPGVIGIGFSKDDAVPRGTFTGLFILGVFVAARMGLVNVIPVLNIFETGSLYWGAFVGYLGLLILSSKWYAKDGAYLFFNLLVLIFGIAALSLGSIYGIPELQKIGGTFFVIWTCEKYFEIPAKNIHGFAFLGMIFFGLMWLGSAFLKTHPDLAATYLLF